MSLKLLAYIGGVPNSKERTDDDFPDKLNHRFTVSLLIVFSMVVTTGQLVGDRIHCWVPAHFSGSWEDYTNSYCWVKNTYYLPFQEYIPKEHENKDMIPYYQWVPIILLVQAFLFYVPCWFWRSQNQRSGIDVDSMVSAALTFHHADKVEEREKTLGYLAAQMKRYLNARRKIKKGCNLSLTYAIGRCCPCCGSEHGTYLIFLYIVSKMLYVANAIGQLFLIDALLGRDFTMYGVDAIYKWASGSEMDPTARFPRVSMCDFKVRFVGNVQRYTVQCALPINLFHEKVFLAVWYWIVFVAIVTVISFLLWLSRFIFRQDRHRYMKKHLRLKPSSKRSDDENKALARFVRDYLMPDGVFVIQLIALNTDTITATDIATKLWEDYKKDQEIDDSEAASDKSFLTEMGESSA